jgi:hypothetical protein
VKRTDLAEGANQHPEFVGRLHRPPFFVAAHVRCHLHQQPRIVAAQHPVDVPVPVLAERLPASEPDSLNLRCEERINLLLGGSLILALLFERGVVTLGR